ncbi:hypothetical protein [Rahnella aquatilis]|uniref:hypothetical protein n=1 Tax=Rahnella aquatilis TaxID=34038 RepID=UPI0012E02A3C|nr:hypothetical protein [Rahnella aquatilis]
MRTNLARDRKVQAILFVLGECRAAMRTTKLSSVAFCEKKAGHAAGEITLSFVEPAGSAKQTFRSSSYKLN